MGVNPTSLAKLYAQRKVAEGHSFPAGNEFVSEFEDSFEFNETPTVGRGVRKWS